MDAYTKAVLTVIAAALCAIALQNAGIGSAVAQNRVPAPVTICNESVLSAGLEVRKPTVSIYMAMFTDKSITHYLG